MVEPGPGTELHERIDIVTSDDSQISGSQSRSGWLPRREKGREYRKGPLRLRGRHIPDKTTDERLLEPSTGEPDWVHSDPWRVMRIQSEFVEGFGALAELGPAISVFGSARSGAGSPEYRLGEQVGGLLVEAGYAVITGGGPGVMEAANKGAYEAGGVSVGLGIELPFEQGMNEWVDLGVNFRYFFARKTMFVKYALGFIVLPGGFGTMEDRKSTRLNSSHVAISYAVFCLKKKNEQRTK